MLTRWKKMRTHKEKIKTLREMELEAGTKVRGCKCSVLVPADIMTLGMWCEYPFISAISPCPLMLRPSLEKPLLLRENPRSCSLQ